MASQDSAPMMSQASFNLKESDEIGPMPAPPPAKLTSEEDALLAALASASPSPPTPEWPKVKAILMRKLALNIDAFLHHPPRPPPPPPPHPSTPFGLVIPRFAPRGPPSPHSTTVRLPTYLDGKESKEELESVMELFEDFDEEAPFTIQRLAELLQHPFTHYLTAGKYLRAVSRSLLVTPSFDPSAYVSTTEPSTTSNNTSTSATLPSDSLTPTPSTPLQLATTPLFTPIPFLEGKDILIPPPRRRSPSPPYALLHVPQRSPSPRGRGRGGGGGGGGGPRIATSSAAMSAQTRRTRSSAVSSPTSPSPSSSPDMSPSPRRPGIRLPPPREQQQQRPYTGGPPPQQRPPTRRPPPPAPAETAESTGPNPTRVDELDDPSAHKTLLDEPVALSSTTTGTKVRVGSPPAQDGPAPLSMMSRTMSFRDPPPAPEEGDGDGEGEGEGGGGFIPEPPRGLGLDLGDRFVRPGSSLTVSQEGKEKEREKERDDAGNGEIRREEGEVERMVIDEPGEGERERGRAEDVVMEDS